MLYNVIHTLALALLMYVVLKRKVVFKTGISLELPPPGQLHRL